MPVCSAAAFNNKKEHPVHEVFLLDIDLDLGDVTALEDVVRYLEGMAARLPATLSQSGASCP